MHAKIVLMKSRPGTYALILQNHLAARAQIGHWRQLDIEPGYYIYVGSAFGPGGVRARVSRHLRMDKPKHWHIDYLREFVTPLIAWVSYETEKLEHRWAQVLFDRRETEAIQGFGCSDCTCTSHLFHTTVVPEAAWLGTVDLYYDWSNAMSSILDTQASYDRIAAEYAEKYKDELEDKPFDRDCLDRLAYEVVDLGLICDLGCGPGQVARYLYRYGLQTLGVDLSPKMVAQAQRLNPEIHFHQGDMLSLPDADNSWGGIAAFYCIIHIPRECIVDALREMKRVLKPGGLLLITFHVGQEIEHLDEWWGKPVDLDFAFYLPEEMEAWLQGAGFELVESLVREPNPEVEVATKRAYLFARKPIVKTKNGRG